MRPSEKAVLLWLAILLVGLILALIRVAHADAPIRIYPERVACGGVQLVSLFADGRYETQPLSLCPYPDVYGAAWFVHRTADALRLLADRDPDGLYRLQVNVRMILQVPGWSGATLGTGVVRTNADYGSIEDYADALAAAVLRSVSQ